MGNNQKDLLDKRIVLRDKKGKIIVKKRERRGENKQEAEDKEGGEGGEIVEKKLAEIGEVKIITEEELSELDDVNFVTRINKSLQTRTPGILVKSLSPIQSCSITSREAI